MGVFKMEPVTLVVVAILVSLGAGFGAGWGLKPSTNAEALANQAESLARIQESQGEILEHTTKPLVIDAELRATLAQTPVACLEDMGGDPDSAACLLMSCWSYGQSNAQRPECEDIKDLWVERAQKQEACLDEPAHTPAE
jgi:hypothetical protein